MDSVISTRVQWPSYRPFFLCSPFSLFLSHMPYRAMPESLSICEDLWCNRLVWAWESQWRSRELRWFLPSASLQPLTAPTNKIASSFGSRQLAGSICHMSHPPNIMILEIHLAESTCSPYNNVQLFVPEILHENDRMSVPSEG